MTVAVPEPPHLVTDLKTLCLATMTAEWRPLAAQATRERQPPAEYLAQLVHLEVTGRRERRIQRRLQEARFPMLKTLDAFQFDAQPELDRDAILQLCGGDFVAEAANVVLVGGVGTGKTHLAIALGMALLPARLSGPVSDGRRVDHAARLRAVRQGRRRPAVRLHQPPLRAREPGRDDQSAVRPLVRGVPGCDRRRGRHRPHRAPCHRADDQRGQLPPQGRPTEPDSPRSTEENALMGTRQRGPFLRCQKVPFLLAISSLEGKTANTPRLGPVSTSRQRIAELVRQAVGMAVAIAWLPGPAGTRRRVAKLSVEEPDAAEPARPDLWGARVSNDPGLPDPETVSWVLQWRHGKGIGKAPLSFWAQSPSKTEEQRSENAIGAIRNAVRSSSKLNHRGIHVFTQGSYRNRVNVRQGQRRRHRRDAL